MVRIDPNAGSRVTAMARFDDTSVSGLLQSKYTFTNDWFDESAREVWDRLVPATRARKILEIGSYEGASTCYLIDNLSIFGGIEIHCVDHWLGGSDHTDLDIEMRAVETRFNDNVRMAIANAPNPVDLHIHKQDSLQAMAGLLVAGKRDYFDFIYVDGSHIASDVLADAVLAFSLLKTGGVLVFDDYLWTEDLRYGRDILRCPKAAIDAFINLNFRRLSIITAPLRQIYVRKEPAVLPPEMIRRAVPSLIRGA